MRRQRRQHQQLVATRWPQMIGLSVSAWQLCAVIGGVWSTPGSRNFGVPQLVPSDPERAVQLWNQECSVISNVLGESNV